MAVLDPRPILLAVLLLASLTALPGGSLDTLPALAPDAERLLALGAPVPIRLDGVTLSLHATPHPVLASDARTVLIGPAGEEETRAPRLTTYDGVIDGRPDLAVRLALRDGVRGLVLDAAGGGWVLAPAADGGTAATPIATLSRPDLDDPQLLPPRDPSAESGGEPRGGGGATLRLRVAWEAAYYFWASDATDWQEDLTELTFLAGLVYAPQLNTEFEVSWLGAWTTPDPYPSYTACTGADGGKLWQFTQYWQANRAGVPRDVAHLAAAGFTGPYIGCAWIGALNDDWSFGVDRIRSHVAGQEAAVLYDNLNLFAHELGHNFYGLHERSLGRYGLTGASGGTPPYTIMNPTAVQGILRFSELQGVHSPWTGWELDNAHPMREFAEGRLGPV